MCRETRYSHITSGDKDGRLLSQRVHIGMEAIAMGLRDRHTAGRQPMSEEEIEKIQELPDQCRVWFEPFNLVERRPHPLLC